MRTCLYICLIFFSALSQAADFAYKATSWADEPPLAELHLLAGPMRSMGFHEIDNIRRGNLPHIGVDQVYVNANWEKSIFVKFGWKVDDRKVRDRLLTLGPGISFHGQVEGYLDFVFFFSGMGRAEAATIMNRVLKEMEYKKKETAWWKGMLMNEAHAQTEAGFCVSCRQQSNLVGQIKILTSPLQLSALRSSISTCLVTAFDAAKGSIKGMVDTVALLFNPAKLWSTVKKAFNGFKEVVMNFSDSMKKVWGAISGITTEMLQSMICPILGGLAPTAIAAALGVGAGRLGMQLANLTKRIIDSSKLLQRVAKMKKLKKEEKAEISRQVGMCAVR